MADLRVRALPGSGYNVAVAPQIAEWIDMALQGEGTPLAGLPCSAPGWCRVISGSGPTARNACGTH